MNILFVYSLQEIESIYKPLKSQEQIQFGISYISAVLREHGHQTKLVVLSRESGMENNVKLLNDRIKSFTPQLICFTSVSSEYGFIATVARYLRQRHRSIYLLIGGVHVSLNPEEALKDDFDFICIGEGEYPTLELVDCLESKKLPSGIPNLWIKNGQAIEKNPARPFLQDLDSLPYPDRDMWQEWIDTNDSSMHTVLLGRGCPFECTYCCNHALKRVASGHYIRHRSPEAITGELKDIIRQFPGNQNIYLEIETIYADKKWAVDLCLKLRSLNDSLEKPLSFGTNIRICPNANYEELFYYMNKSNFRFINIGVESGSEKVRAGILKRIYSNLDVINAVNSARRYNLQVAFYNMMGIPGETYEDFKETIKLNKTCLPDWIMITIFFPYPGTDLYFLCKEKGYLPKAPDMIMERSKAILDLPNFSKRQIQKGYEWFYYDVYEGHKPIYDILARVFTMKLRKRPYLFKSYLLLRRWRPYKQLKILFRKNFNAGYAYEI